MRAAAALTSTLQRCFPASRSWSSRAAAMGAGKHTYEYPRPGLTVDAIILAKPAKSSPMQLLLIERGREPFKGKWALPGGFVDEHESLDAAAARELHEETNVPSSKAFLTQIGMFGDPGRDPRGWVVSAAYAALVDRDGLDVKPGDDAHKAQWFNVSELPQLAFDHAHILKTAFKVLAEKPQLQQEGEVLKQLASAASKL